MKKDKFFLNPATSYQVSPAFAEENPLMVKHYKKVVILVIVGIIGLVVYEIQRRAPLGRIVPEENTRQVRLVHFSDLQNLKAVEGRGSVAVAASVIRTALREVKDEPGIQVIPTFGGNFMSGENYGGRFQGEEMVEVLDALTPNTARYGVLGNLDFQFGLDALKQRMDGKYTWVHDNMKLDGQQSTHIVSFPNISLGMIGVVPDVTDSLVDGDRERVNFTDPVGAALRAMSHFRDNQVSAVIALTHQSFDAACTFAAALDSERVDVILSSHKEADSGLNLKRCPDSATWVGQADQDLASVLVVDLYFQNGELRGLDYARRSVIQGVHREDEEVKAILDKWEKKAAETSAIV